MTVNCDGNNSAWPILWGHMISSLQVKMQFYASNAKTFEQNVQSAEKIIWKCRRVGFGENYVLQEEIWRELLRWIDLNVATLIFNTKQKKTSNGNAASWTKISSSLIKSWCAEFVKWVYPS